MSRNDRRNDDIAMQNLEVESILRGLGAAPEPVDQPPEDIWDRIAAEIGPMAQGAHERFAGGPDAAGAGAADAQAADAHAADADVVPISQARRTRIAGIVGAAAAAAVLVIAGIVVVTGDDSDDGDPVVAEAELTFDDRNFDPLGADATAVAELVEHDDGSFALRLVDTDLPDPGEAQEDLELWLIEPDEAANPVDLVSLGLVDPAEPGVFEVPAGYDPATFSVVDISVEPRDGEPTHSGRSILRGPLEIA